MTEPLLTRREGEVLILSNNNVAARNALSPEFYAAVATALTAAATDPTVGAVVLTGVPAAICANWPSAVSCQWRNAVPSWKACTT